MATPAARLRAPKTAPNVNATSLSRFTPNSLQSSALVIGQNTINPPFPPADNVYWYIVISLKDLSVAATAFSSDESQVPANIAGYGGNADYFLYVIGNSLNGYNIAQGALYQFLVKIGSSSGLAQLEQMIQQLGTTTIQAFSYILAATMAENDIPGFESWSVTDISVLTMQFMAVQIGNQWIYAPIQQQ